MSGRADDVFRGHVMEDVPRNGSLSLVPGVNAQDKPTVFHLLDQTSCHLSREAEILQLLVKLVRKRPSKPAAATGRFVAIGTR